MKIGIAVIGIGILIIGVLMLFFPLRENYTRTENATHIPVDRTLSGIEQTQVSWNFYAQEGQKLRVKLTPTENMELSVYGTSQEVPKLFLVDRWPVSISGVDMAWSIPFDGTYYVDVRKTITSWEQTVNIYGDIYLDNIFIESRTVNSFLYLAIAIVILGGIITAFAMRARA